MRFRLCLSTMCSVLIGIAFTGASASAAEAPVAQFLGHFVGQTLIETDRDISLRDLDVKVVEKDKGFSVEWTTITHGADQRRKQTFSTVQFRPTERSGIYRSANRRDRFGKALPTDPVGGEPYMWARISGHTLTVYVMQIVEGGGYDIQTYARTVQSDGMELLFTRTGDGRPLREIRAKLRKNSN
jgi:hypothetical protein